MSATNRTVPDGRRDTSHALTNVGIAQAWLDAAQAWLKVGEPARAREAIFAAWGAVSTAYAFAAEEAR